MRVRSLRDRQLGDARRAAWFLLGAVGALLLIACTNVANLLLARSVTRQRELAIRAALGAGRARLARLALTESALLALAGGALGLTVAWMLLRTFITLAPRGIPKLDQASLDLRAAGAALALALVAALLTGMWPSLSIPRPSALQGARSNRFRAAMGEIQLRRHADWAHVRLARHFYTSAAQPMGNGEGSTWIRNSKSPLRSHHLERCKISHT